MVINPIVGVYIPIIRIPIKGGMTIPNIATFDHGTFRVVRYLFVDWENLAFADILFMRLQSLYRRLNSWHVTTLCFHMFSCLDLQDILAKLVQMTAGAGMFPGDDTVDQLWIEMDAAAQSPTVPGGWDSRQRGFL